MSDSGCLNAIFLFVLAFAVLAVVTAMAEPVWHPVYVGRVETVATNGVLVQVVFEDGDRATARKVKCDPFIVGAEIVRVEKDWLNDTRLVTVSRKEATPGD